VPLSFVIAEKITGVGKSLSNQYRKRGRVWIAKLFCRKRALAIETGRKVRAAAGWYVHWNSQQSDKSSKRGVGWQNAIIEERSQKVKRAGVDTRLKKIERGT